MLLTVTLNPSIDISYPLEHLDVDNVNRVKTVSRTAGGKGLNVSRVAQALGEDVTATGFVGGNYGKELIVLAENDGITSAFTEIAGSTRESIALLHDGGNQTEILEAGPTISDDEKRAFIKHFEQLLDDADVVTLSGSLPQGLDPEFYSQLIEMCDDCHVKVLLDTSNQALEASIKAEHKPVLIKPNDAELAALLGREINSTDELKDVLLSDELKGIECVIVSLGKDGAIGRIGDKCYKANIPTLDHVVNPVGSGDSTIAGFAVAIARGLSAEEILKYGMTCGMLNAQEEKTGYINKANFPQLHDQIEIEEI